MSKYYPFTLAIVIVIIDQALKIWVKLNMTFNQHFNVLGDWFKVLFIENEGMAFGIQLGGADGKLALTLFRILAVLAFTVLLYRLQKQSSNKTVLLGVSILLAGTLGNVIDSIFYGVIFSDSTFFQKAVFLPDPPLKAYSTWFYGNVVDMFYFPLMDGNFPAWFPEKPLTKPLWCPEIIYNIFPWANDNWVFFRPVFNVADSAITIFMFLFIIKQKHFSFELERVFTKKNSTN